MCFLVQRGNTEQEGKLYKLPLGRVGQPQLQNAKLLVFLCTFKFVGEGGGGGAVTGSWLLALKGELFGHTIVKTAPETHQE